MPGIIKIRFSIEFQATRSINEKYKKGKSINQGLFDMQETIQLAKKMGKNLGRSQILQQQV